MGSHSSLANLSPRARRILAEASLPVKPLLVVDKRENARSAINLADEEEKEDKMED